MRKHLGLLTALLTGFLGTQTILADQLVTNGGFETGDFSGWTLTGPATTSSYPGGFYGVDTQDAASGTYGAYLGSEFSTLTLAQTLTVVPRNYYTVTFSLAQTSTPLTGFTNSFAASFNGQTFFTESAAAVSPSTNYSFTVSTTPTNAASALLSFTSQNDLGYFSLDNVSVSTGAATPEPASFFLIAPAALGFFAFRRKLAGLAR